jgi:hypothetical protein
MSPLMKGVELFVAGAVCVLGAVVLYLFGAYALRAGGIARFHVESWALIFVTLGLTSRLLRNINSQQVGQPSGPPAWTWAVYCGLAVALYRRALGVGFLSDDYVLVARADNWNVGPVTEALFRPIPLSVWALLLDVGAGAPTLHLLNILLHGTNAYLTARIAAGFGTGRWWSIGAGLLMLTAPLASEAVVWLSGVFDLASTTLVLLSILVARRYDGGPSTSTRVQLVVLGLAALASKETAVVAGGLVLVDAWARHRLSRKLCIDSGIVLAIAGTIGAIRLATAYGTSPPSLSRYILQRALFGGIGALAVPWHIDIAGRLPWLPIAGVAAVVFLTTSFFVGRATPRQQTRFAFATAVWMLLPIVPIVPILFVAPDLQQARYLYLPGFAWATFLTLAASERRRQVLALSTLAGLMVIGAYGTFLHQRPWQAAAEMRDEVETAARGSGMEACQPVSLSNLPDSVDGAYVFRNGAVEAFARDLRLDVRVAENGVQAACSFRWDEGRLTFVRSTGE